MSTVLAETATISATTDDRTTDRFAWRAIWISSSGRR